MNEEQAFLEAMLDAPNDMTARLVFADWLEERGDPRAELLRLQVELLQLDVADWQKKEGRLRSLLYEENVPPVVATITNAVGIKLAVIPPGEFMMGSPKSEKKRKDIEGPQHPVRITRPFFLGVYPVTQGEYEAVMQTGRSYWKGWNADWEAIPISGPTWFEAVVFCNQLSERDGKSPFYSVKNIQHDRDEGFIRKADVKILRGSGYRLPTEAEWEYACRAGTTTTFHFGRSLSSEQANFNGEKPYGGAAKGVKRNRRTAPGLFLPNAFGLYDMHGNVWEWCQDWFYPYEESLAIDPVCAEGRHRVSRGGGCLDSSWLCRAAVRMRDNPSAPHSGLRVAASIE